MCVLSYYQFVNYWPQALTRFKDNLHHFKPNKYLLPLFPRYFRKFKINDLFFRNKVDFFFCFGHFYYFQPNKYLLPKIFSKIDDLFLRNQVEFVFLLLAIFCSRTDVNPRRFLQPNFRRGAVLFVDNYVDQILPNFDPLPLEDMDILHTIYPLSRDPLFLST